MAIEGRRAAMYRRLRNAGDRRRRLDGRRGRRYRPLGSQGQAAGRSIWLIFLDPSGMRLKSMAAAGLPAIPRSGFAVSLRQWASDGIPRVKMKVGRDAGADVDRVRAASQASWDRRPNCSWMPTAAYSRKQALAMARIFAD